MTINLAIAVGNDTKVHAADCADLRKAPTKRAAYNGIHTQSFPEGTDERAVWIDYNEDFLEEGGADAAWPLTFLPCCASAGLVANPDRSWGEEAEEVAEVEVVTRTAVEGSGHITLGLIAAATDTARRNELIVHAHRVNDLPGTQIAKAARLSTTRVYNILKAAA